MTSSGNYIDHPVHDRLRFAERRLNDLRVLNSGDFGGADPRERQALLQEFFFHLCGSIDFLAQEVNIVRVLNLGQDDVTVGKVREALTRTNGNDAIISLLGKLHPKVRKQLFPQTRIPKKHLTSESSFFATSFRTFGTIPFALMFRGE
jgi:hypothetical protein